MSNFLGSGYTFRGGTRVTTGLLSLGSKRELNARPLNPEQIVQCAHRMKFHPVIMSILQTITDSAIGGGIQIIFKMFNIEHKSSELMQDMLDREWKTFAIQLLRSILCFGVAVWKPVKSRRIEGEYVPVLIALDDCEVKFYYKDHERFWVINESDPFLVGDYKSTINQPIKDARIAIVYEPDKNGDLVSPLASVMQYLLDIEARQQNYRVADFGSSYVRMLLTTGTHSGAAGGNPNTTARSASQFADGDHRRMIERDQIIAAERAQQALHDLKYNRVPATASQVDSQSHAIVRGAEFDGIQEAVLLPAGLTTAQAPVPRQASDHERYLDINLVLIAQTFGVPQNIVSVSKTTHASNERTGFTLFNDTVRNYQLHVMPVLQEAFTCIFASRMSGHVKNSITHDERALGRPLTVKEMAQYAKNITCNVILPRTPRTTAEEIDSLYQDEIISFDRYAQHKANIVGVSPLEIMTNAERTAARIKRASQAALMEKIQASHTGPVLPSKASKSNKSSSSSKSKQQPQKQKEASKESPKESPKEPSKETSKKSAKPKEKEKSKEAAKKQKT